MTNANKAFKSCSTKLNISHGDISGRPPLWSRMNEICQQLIDADMMLWWWTDDDDKPSYFKYTVIDTFSLSHTHSPACVHGLVKDLFFPFCLNDPCINNRASSVSRRRLLSHVMTHTVGQGVCAGVLRLQLWVITHQAAAHLWADADVKLHSGK